MIFCTQLEDVGSLIHIILCSLFFMCFVCFQCLCPPASLFPLFLSTCQFVSLIFDHLSVCFLCFCSPSILFPLVLSHNQFAYIVFLSLLFCFPCFVHLSVYFTCFCFAYFVSSCFYSPVSLFPLIFVWLFVGIIQNF